MQPDNRVKTDDINFLSLVDGKAYAIHDRPGCPRNACIEVFDGYLRCWACHTPLTDDAVGFIRAACEETEQGTFIVKKRSGMAEEEDAPDC